MTHQERAADESLKMCEEVSEFFVASKKLNPYEASMLSDRFKEIAQEASKIFKVHCMKGNSVDSSMIEALSFAHNVSFMLCRLKAKAKNVNNLTFADLLDQFSQFIK